EVRKIKSIERIINQKFELKQIPDGMAICETQLMSLANKIHNTEVNHEIDKYLTSINELFEDTSKDELIKKFFSVEFTRFYNYYQRSKNLNVTDSRSSDRDSDRDSGRDYGSSDNSSRYFINVGKKDGYDWMSLKDFLKDILELGRDDVFKVDVKDSFSFFNTEKELQEKVLAFFQDFKHNGRFVNVEVSEDKGRGTSRNKRRSSGGSDRRSGGNFKPRAERRSGGSDRRSSESRPRRSGDSSGPNRKERRSSGDFKPAESSFSRPRRSRRKD
ncbi:MAG: DbpA RNA binding domain-containing protein, partial [Gelidibacter sp.]|nr:DbpA RNA binding domain-containing protein [Gelidibacter sp.]